MQKILLTGDTNVFKISFGQHLGFWNPDRESYAVCPIIYKKVEKKKSFEKNQENMNKVEDSWPDHTLFISGFFSR